MLYELLMTHPAGMGEKEHTLAYVWLVTLLMEYATPVPAQLLVL
ncbi:hypothetical protein ACFQ0T_02310 [Kitasatospora gansuensis]